MTDYQKLKNIIDEIDTLISKRVTASNPDFEAWRMKTERFLIKKYGANSLEREKFSNTSFSLHIFLGDTPESSFIKACKEDLQTTKKIFLTYLQEMEEETQPDVSNAPNINLSYSKIFIVHGHDGELMHAVARVIEKQNIEAIILSEKENKGRTIIEKFEDYSDVSGAICLFTADDLGKTKNDTIENARARQNVVLETGYFMGRLGRAHVIILADKGIEMPSDLSGVVYTNTASWEFELLKELKAIGYKVDLNKLL